MKNSGWVHSDAVNPSKRHYPRLICHNSSIAITKLSSWWISRLWNAPIKMPVVQNGPKLMMKNGQYVNRFMTLTKLGELFLLFYPLRVTAWVDYKHLFMEYAADVYNSKLQPQRMRSRGRSMHLFALPSQCRCRCRWSATFEQSVPPPSLHVNKPSRNSIQKTSSSNHAGSTRNINKPRYFSGLQQLLQH